MIFKKFIRFLMHRLLRHKSNLNINIKAKKILIYILGFLFINFFFFNDKKQNLNELEREIEGWPKNMSRNMTDYILPDINTTLLHSNVCDNYESKSPLFLLIVVTSSVENFEARQAIRKTWGNTSKFNYKLFDKLHESQSAKYLKINHTDWQKYAELKDESTNFRVRVVFLLGLPSSEKSEIQQSIISYEHDRYGDIIQENFIDRYNNLTLKSVFMLKWVQKNCLDNVKYIMKCDDDMFVNVPNLIHILLGGTIPIYNSTIKFYDAETIFVTNQKNRLLQTKNLILGQKFCDERRNTNISSTWFTPDYMYSESKYPEFVGGGAYVISTETVKLLYMQSLSVPFLFLEDVYVTGIVAEKSKVMRTHNPLFLCRVPDWTDNDDKCLGRGIAVRHGFKPTKMYEFYSFVTNLTIQCATYDEKFLSTNANFESRRGCY